MTATVPETPNLDTATQAATQVDIFSKAIALNLSIGCLGSTKKLSTSQIEVDADKKLISVSKAILASREFENIKRRQREVGTAIRKLCLPSLFRSGIYLVPIATLSQIDKILLEAQQDLEAFLIPAFLEVYPGLVEADKVSLRGCFNPMDYPPLSKVQDAFTFSWSYVSFGVPESIQAVNADVYIREQEKAAAQVRQAAEDIQQLLRSQMLDLVSHLADKLGGKEDGKKKAFKNTTVTNVRDFLETFENRNIVNDADLDRLCSQARALLNGVDPDSLRNQDIVRDRVRTGFEAIKTELDTMIVAKPSRMIKFASKEDSDE